MVHRPVEPEGPMVAGPQLPDHQEADRERDQFVVRIGQHPPDRCAVGDVAGQVDQRQYQQGQCDRHHRVGERDQPLEASLCGHSGWCACCR
jgi:hypothetical protein